MQNLKIHTNPKVKQKFDSYSDDIHVKISALRNIIVETANEVESVTELEETLKWGEPSYIAKKGSTIRIDWKSKTPNQYAIYFKCTSKLIPTFKMMYENAFEFEGNRAIVFQMDNKLPIKELKKCIATALTYHTVKHLPRLGM